MQPIAVNTLLLCLLGVSANAQEIATATTSVSPITLDANSSELNHSTGTLHFHQVTIRQDQMSLSADEAYTDNLEFADSEWKLKDRVKIETPNTTLIADHATLLFKNYSLRQVMLQGGQLQHQTESGSISLTGERADITFLNSTIYETLFYGTPVKLSADLRPGQDPIVGEAQRLRLEFPTAVVNLEGEAHISDKNNQISGARIVYDLRSQQLTARRDPIEKEPIHIVIQPRKPIAKPDEQENMTPNESND